MVKNITHSIHVYLVCLFIITFTDTFQIHCIFSPCVHTYLTLSLSLLSLPPPSLSLPSPLSIALSHFFEIGDGTYRTDIIQSILSKLTPFIEWMEKQDVLRLFATSLLIVYEGGPIPLEQEPGSLDIRLVDFAHCYERGDTTTPDGNALYGVRVFMKHLEEINSESSD